MREVTSVQADKVTIVSAGDINWGFAKMASSGEEYGFYAPLCGFLATQAGKEMDLVEFTQMLLQALLTHVPLGRSFNLGMIVNVLVGKDGVEMGERSKRVFKDIADLFSRAD